MATAHLVIELIQEIDDPMPSTGLMAGANVLQIIEDALNDVPLRVGVRVLGSTVDAHGTMEGWVTVQEHAEKCRMSVEFTPSEEAEPAPPPAE